MRRLILFVVVLVSCLIPRAFLAQTVAIANSHATDSPLNRQWIAFSRAGAPNSNLQCFTPSDQNIYVNGGFLNVIARLQTATCASFDLTSASYNYTSAFVAMRTFNYLYGSLEFRMQVGPSGSGGNGQWPAVWMEDATCQPSDPTGTNNDCNGQEIDVAEFLHTFTTVNQQIHVAGNHNDQCSPTLTDASTNFHVYDLVWSAGSLVFSIDGVTSCTITQSWVPNAAMYVKVVYGVGGQGGGAITDGSLPWQLQLDYLKVGQGCSGINPLSGCSSIPFTDDFN